MPTHRVAWLICALAALAGLALGYRTYAGRAAATVVVEWSTASELDTAGFEVGGEPRIGRKTRIGLRGDDPRLPAHPWFFRP